MLVSHKVIGSMLIMASIACIIILIIGNLGRDKNAPEISFSEDNELVYEEGEPSGVLLEDVTAFDKEDGEVTDDLVIESVYDFNNGSAKVVYAVRDKSGNIAKAERIITYQKAEQTETTPTAVEPGTPDESIDAFGEHSDEQEQNDEEGELLPDGENPVLRLTQSRVELERGAAFNELNYVEEIVDDKDDRAQLFRRIIINGEVNVNQPGTYELQYRVTDSDGNPSAEKTLTVVVQD